LPHPTPGVGKFGHNDHVRPDLVELSRTVDAAVLGGRLRAARQRRGMTQSELARDLASTAYVSRIEAGQRRPDAALLERLAARLGVEADQLLRGVTSDQLAALRVRLDHAQLALVTGDPQRTLTELGALAGDPLLAELPDLVREAAYLRVGAYEATGDLQGAILLLEDLAEQQPFDLVWLDGVTALSRCYRESGDLARAIQVAEDAQRYVDDHDLGNVGEAVKLTLTMAAAYAERGDVDHAARICRRAVDHAERLGSRTARASAYWNASVVESRRGNAATAVPLAQRALRLLEESDESRNVARLRTQLGILQLRSDPPDVVAALNQLTRARAELEATEASPVDLADNALAQARAYFLLGDTDRALRRAQETEEHTRTGAPLVAADAHVLQGQIAAREGDVALARRHYQRAILLLTGSGSDRGAAQLWYELGGLLEQVDEPAHALDAYRRAGASSGLVALRLPAPARGRSRSLQR
jgi:transcriptional regulator with XRE-family HTH domain